LDYQYYDVPMAALLQKLCPENLHGLIQDGIDTKTHWLYSFLLEQMQQGNQAYVTAIYCIATILLTQTQGHVDNTDFIMHAIGDVAGWENITYDEWDCIEFLLMCIGWTLGVHCKFPVILWLQGHPKTGKSTLLSFIESTVRSAFKLNASDNSKHMMGIVHRSNGTIVADPVIVLDDVQRPLPQAAIPLLCSITDPGPTGDITCDPKGKDPITIDKTDCSNVCAIVASNISTRMAISNAEENTTGLPRRLFVLSFATHVSTSEHDPKEMLQCEEVRAMLLMLCVSIGHYYSFKANSRPPVAPTLLREMNTSYESGCRDSIYDIMQNFVIACVKPLAVTENKALCAQDARHCFFSYCTKVGITIPESKNISSTKFISNFTKILAEVFGTDYSHIKLYGKLIYCIVCGNVYNWEDTTGMAKVNKLTVAAARANAEAKNCTCASPQTRCSIIAKQQVYIHIALHPFNTQL